MEGHSTVEDQRPRNSYHRVCYVFVAQAASACHWNWTAMGDGQHPTEGDSRLRGTRGASPTSDKLTHMAQLMPLPLTVSCFSKIQIGFTFLVLAHPGSPGKRAVKRVCVCVLRACVVHLRSAGCHQLFVPRHRRSMFGRWAFSVAGPCVLELVTRLPVRSVTFL